jgi:hypothetical protein
VVARSAWEVRKVSGKIINERDPAAVAQGAMKRMNKTNSHLGGFNSGASLGGKVSHYRDKQHIYKQGAPA